MPGRLCGARLELRSDPCRSRCRGRIFSRVPGAHFRLRDQANVSVCSGVHSHVRGSAVGPPPYGCGWTKTAVFFQRDKLLCYSAWHAAACGVHVQYAAHGLRSYQRVLVLAPLRRSVTLRWFQRGLVLAPLRRSFMYSGVVPLPPHRPPRCACVLGAAAPLANIIRCCNIPGTEAGSGASVLLATDSCHSCVGT